MTRLTALLKKEFIQMSRDRLTFAMMVAIPVIQLLLFGFAINTDVKHLATAVYDQSLQQEGRDLLSSLEASGYFDIEYVVNSYQEITELIDRGEAKAGIIIPPDFSQNLKHGKNAAIQMIVDASDSLTASSAISSAQLIAQMKSKEILLKKIPGSASINVNAYDIRIRPWYNPDFVSAFYMVPGILGVVITLTMVMITSMAIVREREQGTMEQLIVTPIKSYELMLGKIIPYVLLGYIQMTLALIVGILVFDVPMRGSLGLLYLLTSLFIIASLTLGIMISNFAKTQMQAMQMSVFVFLPSMLLSGFMFPRESMPMLFNLLGNLLPISFYLEILRGIILKGIGINYLWSQTFALLTFIIVMLGISILKFKKKLV